MQLLTQEWVEKAEGDFATLQREMRARLQEANTLFPRTHDLEQLLMLLLPVEPSWSGMRPALQVLTAYGVQVRYPGTSADRAMAREAFKDARAARLVVRQALGLPI
jgi:hypothetical protein